MKPETQTIHPNGGQPSADLSTTQSDGAGTASRPPFQFERRTREEPRLTIEEYLEGPPLAPVPDDEPE